MQLGVTGVVVFVDGVVGGPVVGGDEHPALGLGLVAVAAVKKVTVEEEDVPCNRKEEPLVYTQQLPSCARHAQCQTPSTGLRYPSFNHCRI